MEGEYKSMTDLCNAFLFIVFFEGVGCLVALWIQWKQECQIMDELKAENKALKKENELLKKENNNEH